MKKFFKITSRIAFWLIICSIIFPVFSWLIFKFIFVSKIQGVDEVKKARVAIVFGAGLLRDGTPSPVLRDRVKTAVDLLEQGKVEKILLSGDNRFVEYNEPGAMRAYAISLGAAPENLVLDYAGRRTYDTCYRANEIFKIKEAILVTQNYHLPRALFLCEQLGIQSIGVKADDRIYSERSLRYWNFREILATAAAIWDVWIVKPIPVLGEEQPIF